MICSVCFWQAPFVLSRAKPWFRPHHCTEGYGWLSVQQQIILLISCSPWLTRGQHATRPAYILAGQWGEPTNLRSVVMLYASNRHFHLYGLRGSNVSWFMCWFRHLSVSLTFFLFLPFFLFYFFPSLCFLSYLFTSLLVYFLTYLSTPSRTDPFHIQAGGCRRRPNLALVFRVHFML